MRLEGSLDAFGLPDVLQLLVSTSKTGTLRLRRLTPTATSGQVRVQGGRIAGATSDEGREALARRLVAAGLVDRAALTSAVEAVEAHSAPTVVDALLAAGAVGSDAYEPVARAQATDAVFDLLRWTEGEFAFEVADPAAEPGDAVSWDANDIVLEAQRRLGAWDSVASRLPAADAALRLVGQPGDEIVLGSDEWTIVRLVDGVRTTADLVTLIGKGEWETATTLAALVERGLIVASDGGMERELGASALLARVEGAPAPPMEPPAAARMPAPRVESTPVRDAEPDRPAEPVAPIAEPEPVPVAVETVPVMPDLPVPVPVASAPASATASAPTIDVASPASPAVGEVVGSVVTKPRPEEVPAPAAGDDADAGVSRALLLRLIAGVRSL
ncbi:MAG TPA: DUF4388 domain-containing protein [Mycobacteriales bacterium]|nr:DUF4388 domain-containing protein [Mycobacteriales bacterium]